MTVCGPTDLIIRTRLDLAADAGAEAPYGIEVLRNGEPWIARSYTTEPLLGDRYKERPDVVPGKSRRLDASLPAGVFTLTLRPGLADSTRQMTARILIPAKDVGLQPNEN
jgi:hypothetical protein